MLPQKQVGGHTVGGFASREVALDDHPSVNAFTLWKPQNVRITKGPKSAFSIPLAGRTSATGISVPSTSRAAMANAFSHLSID